MTPEQTLLNYPLFGDNATKVEPDNNKKSNGWQQADVVPAEWMNWAWYHNSKGIKDLNDGVSSMEAELNNVLSEAGITPSVGSNNQVFKAIQKNNGCIITPAATPKTITGAPAIEAGNVIRVMFGADVTGNDTTTGLTISYNGSAKSVKVNKNGTLEEMKAYEITTGIFKYIQKNTIIEFVYDGTDFIVSGNPVVLSGADYTIYADGSDAVDRVESGNMKAVTSNAVAYSLSQLGKSEIIYSGPTGDGTVKTFTKSIRNFRYLLIRFITNAEYDYALIPTDVIDANTKVCRTLMATEGMGLVSLPFAYQSTAIATILTDTTFMCQTVYNNPNWTLRVDAIWGIK